MKKITPTIQFSTFISSPSGLDAEQSIVIGEIQSLSEQALLNKTPGLSIVKWPDNIAAGAASYGQSVINRQTAHYDILICLIGTRMGTPTPRALSGTEEEFDRAIEAILSGKPVQVLLFFSNILVRPQSLDPNQFLLVRAFREKASRLGVLYHTYGDHEELRHLLQISLREAYEFLCGNSETSRYRLKTENMVTSTQPQIILLGDKTLSDCHTAPQWADWDIVSLAEYQRQNIRLSWTMRTSSSYFRFGFKYYDSREAPVSIGSVQTFGHNILLHVGKNRENPTWFATSYRAGYRLGPDVPLEGTAGRISARFVLDISSSDSVIFSLDDKPIYEAFFPIDGIPNLAIMAWGDEHKFQCEVHDLTLLVKLRSERNP